MATNISYNGAVIGSLESGQTATLACAGKKAVGNITVAFDSAGNITHNGSTTDVEAGKTATLQCAGKKMTSDVYVTVQSDKLAGTWVFNDVLDLSVIYVVDLDFTSNGQDYTKMTIASASAPSTAIRNTLRYVTETTSDYAYRYGEWNNTAYKTIEISTLYADVTVNAGNADPSEFLIWLQANATKQ